MNCQRAASAPVNSPSVASRSDRIASAHASSVDHASVFPSPTLEIASLVGPGGSVTGVDMDEIKLDLGRRAAARRGLDNIEFRLLDVRDWDEPGSYDAVYSRFLLQHLAEPVDLLRRMWAGVRPGGALIVEDADFDGWCCDPPDDSFDFFLRTYMEVLRRRGGDHAIGRKLYAHFLAAGIPGARLAVVQPVRTDLAASAAKIDAPHSAAKPARANSAAVSGQRLRANSKRRS